MASGPCWLQWTRVRAQLATTSGCTCLPSTSATPRTRLSKLLSCRFKLYISRFRSATMLTKADACQRIDWSGKCMVALGSSVSLQAQPKVTNLHSAAGECPLIAAFLLCSLGSSGRAFSQAPLSRPLMDSQMRTCLIYVAHSD